MSIYQKDDLGFDLEIRGNFFVNSQIYPDQKLVIVSFLEKLAETDYNPPKPKKDTKIKNDSIKTDIINDQDDSRIIDSTPDIPEPESQPKHDWHYGFLQKHYDNGLNDYKVENMKDRLQMATNHIKNVVKPMKNYQIKFENLATIKGFKSFVERYGISVNKTTLNATKLKQKLQKYKVVYDTDDNYDKTKQGLRIGYNSINYDETMIAYLISKLNGETVRNLIRQANNTSPKDEEYFQKLIQKSFYDSVINKHSGAVLQSTPERLVDFNTKMFNSKFGMSSALGAPWDKTQEIATYKAWNLSNRYVDVSALNPKYISLKRCAMALGYKIQESDSNRDPVAPLDTLDKILDLIAYNVNDIYVTLKIFESGEYMNRFKQNKQLLQEFPYAIYEQTKQAQQSNAKKKIDYVIDQDNIREKRLTVNSTSTKLVEAAIAPYPNTKIKDNKVLTLNFPDAKIAKELDEQGKLPKEFHGKPINVLDYIQILLEKQFKANNLNSKHIIQIRSQYQKLKELYEPYIGKNFNNEMPGKVYDPSKMPKQHATLKYINPQGTYVDNHNRGIASYINLSIGGTHGAEVQQSVYDKDLKEYQERENLLQETVDYLNKTGNYDKHPVTKENLGVAIAGLLPDEPFTHVKKMKLPFNEKYTFGDILQKSASRKKPKFRTNKQPKLFDGTKVDKKYSFTSYNWANHEDFSSYYPSLISLLAIFRNADGYDLFTDDLYKPRLKMKALSKDETIEEAKRLIYALRQKSMKLIINAASGGGDAGFDSNIKCNNKMIAMRIIGQIFCWYIGQCLAIHNARIPSTNTDGLYSMNIEENLNNKIVINCAKDLLLKIDPEKLPLFVSKDANNRLEKDNHGISNARGGALTSWQGPGTQNSVDHPAITDNILAQYLAKKEDAVNQDFDEEFAKSLFNNFIFKENQFNQTKSQILRFLQLPLAANPNKARYFYETKIDDPTNYKLLNNTNRIFIAKASKSNTTIKQTSLQVVQPGSAFKNNSDGKYLRDVLVNDPIAMQVIKTNSSYKFFKNLLDQPLPGVKKSKAGAKVWDTSNTDEKPRNMINSKIKNVPNNTPVILFNEDLHHVTDEEYNQIIESIDFNSYLQIVKKQFNDQWKNKYNDGTILENNNK